MTLSILTFDGLMTYKAKGYEVFQPIGNLVIGKFSKGNLMVDLQWAG